MSGGRCGLLLINIELKNWKLKITNLKLYKTKTTKTNKL